MIYHMATTIDCNTLGFRLRLRHHASQMQQYSFYFVSFLDDLHLADRVTFVCVYVCTYLGICIINHYYPYTKWYIVATVAEGAFIHVCL